MGGRHRRCLECGNIFRDGEDHWHEGGYASTSDVACLDMDVEELIDRVAELEAAIEATPQGGE
jgi:hypothetical protein